MRIKISWRLILQIISFVTGVASLAWITFDLGFDSITTFLGASATFIGSFITSDEPISVFWSDQEKLQHEREKILLSVKKIWVTGYLGSSLRDLPYIEPGIERAPKAIEPGWGIVLDDTFYDQEKIPQDAKPLSIYDEAGHELLILGEPGSGKSTLMLTLVKELIERSLKDASQTIPVVLNLSSWADNTLPFGSWIAQELSTKYQIPKKLGMGYLEANRFALFLDGLDEVTENKRGACIEAINQYRQSHLIDIVVCCRTAEYQAVHSHLHMKVAIVLRPLTTAQIDAHLALLGEPFSELRQILQNSPRLQELITTPLMLNLAAAVDHQLIRSMDTSSIDLEEYHKRLMGLYVKRMLAKKPNNSNYSVDQVTCWLAWLAHNMLIRGQTIFLIEQMQPDWLGTSAQHRIYHLNTILLGGLVGGILCLSSPLLGVVDNWITALTFCIPFALVGALTGALLAFIGQKGLIDPLEKLKWAPKFSWKGLLKGLKVGLNTFFLVLLVDVVLTLYFIFTGENPDSIVFIALAMPFLGVPLAIIIGGVFGLLGAITGNINYRWILGGLFGGILVNIPIFIITYYETMYVVNHMDRIYNLDLNIAESGLLSVSANMLTILGLGGAITGILFGCVFGFLAGIMGAVLTSIQVVDQETKIKPNQGIRQSIRNGLIIGSMLTLIMGLSGGLIVYYIMFNFFTSSPSFYFSYSLGFGGITGLVCGMLYGGRAGIRHYALRFTLQRYCLAPPKLEKFLDHVVQLTFLRKVGGGYIFLHRSVMEYFGNIYKAR